MLRARPAAARGPARGGAGGCRLASPPRSLESPVISTTSPSRFPVPEVLPDQPRSASIVDDAVKRGGMPIVRNPPPPIAHQHRKRVRGHGSVAADHDQLPTLAAHEVAGTVLPPVLELHR